MNVFVLDSWRGCAHALIRQGALKRKKTNLIWPFVGARM